MLKLDGGKDKPTEILVPDNEREWGNWLQGYRTVGQESSIRFCALLVLCPIFTLIITMIMSLYNLYYERKYCTEHEEEGA